MLWDTWVIRLDQSVKHILSFTFVNVIIDIGFLLILTQLLFVWSWQKCDR